MLFRNRFSSLLFLNFGLNLICSYYLALLPLKIYYYLTINLLLLIFRLLLCLTPQISLLLILMICSWSISSYSFVMGMLNLIWNYNLW